MGTLPDDSQLSPCKLKAMRPVSRGNKPFRLLVRHALSIFILITSIETHVVSTGKFARSCSSIC